MPSSSTAATTTSHTTGTSSKQCGSVRLGSGAAGCFIELRADDPGACDQIMSGATLLVGDCDEYPEEEEQEAHR